MLHRVSAVISNAFHSLFRTAQLYPGYPSTGTLVPLFCENQMQELSRTYSRTFQGPFDNKYGVWESIISFPSGIRGAKVEFSKK